VDHYSVPDEAVFDHEGPWTEAAYLALRHDGRVEVVDGTLLVGPGAGPQRTWVIERVRAAVAAALPDGLRVRGPLPVRLGPDCVLVPDLVVTAAPLPPDADVEEPADETADGAGDETAGTPDEARPEAADEEPDDDILDAAAVLMVIEVVGSDHGATDRTFKPQLYARSRIPYSLLIDHDGPFALVNMIISGRYHEYASAGGDEILLIEEPFRLELDLAALTAPEPPGASADPTADPAAGTRSAKALPEMSHGESGDPARPVKA
jgi:Putative restriction endonuclease